MGFQIGNLLTLCKNPDPAFKPRLGCCVFVWDTCLDRPFCTQKRRRNSKVNWKQKFWRLSVVDQERQYSRSGQAKERGTTPPPLPRTFFLLQTLFGEGTLLSQCSLHPRVSVIGVMSGKLDKLLGEGGGVDLWLTSVPLRGVLLSPYILWTARASRNITQGIKLSIEQLHTFPSL